MSAALRNVWILASNSLQENWRSRFYLLSVAFGLLFLYMSLLLGLLAQEQEVRVLLDFGLALIELIGLAGGLYAAATVFLREMETKTIYLILTRPVSRGQYLLGRYLGLLLSVGGSMLVMAAMHVVILVFKGWHPTSAYLLALFGAFVKVALTSALGAFLALFSSSVLTALGIAAILWTLGHFLPEMRYMIAWGAPHAAIAPLTALTYVIPDLQIFNVRDRLVTTATSPTELKVWAQLGYAFVYAAVWLALGRVWIARKEF